MDYGALNGYFDGAVAKTLAAVDISPAKSNQHEFNGTGPLRALFGDDDIKGMPTTFAYLEDSADPVFDHGFTTWYDARRRHPTRTEYRLYYNDNKCIAAARPGDLMVLAISDAGEVLIAFAKAGTTAESQLRWLFGVGDTADTGFKAAPTDSLRIDAMAAQILESIGIEVGIPSAADGFLDGLVERFGDSFPKGADFSAYSVSTLGELDWEGDPDGSLVSCYEREELLFRVFERHILERDLAPFLGTTLDVDGVLRVTMSTFQRRKSRAGTAFENQLSMLFDARGIRYSAQKYTEGKSKPDFVFPEPAVSSDYTTAMEKDRLQLVVPRPIFPTYTPNQREWLMDIKEFCEMVESRQKE